MNEHEVIVMINKNKRLSNHPVSFTLFIVHLHTGRGYGIQANVGFYLLMIPYQTVFI